MNLTPAADIYSLGATLYHMLTGAVPFDGKNPSAVMHKHLKAELIAPDHVNPKLSAGISEVVEMMMAKDARARYQNASQLLEDLDAALEGRDPVHARPTEAFVSTLESSPEADGDTPVPVLAGSSGPDWKLITLGALLVVSALLNLVQFLARK